jgi:hypothetical protein
MGFDISKSQDWGIKKPSHAQQGYVHVKMVHVVSKEVTMTRKSTSN